MPGGAVGGSSSVATKSSGTNGTRRVALWFDRLRLPATGGALALGLGLAAGPATGAPIRIDRNIDVEIGGAEWENIRNDNSRSVGALTNLPSFVGGEGADDPFAISDARTPDNGDAFDGFAGLLVNGVAFNHPDDQADLTTTSDGVFLSTLAAMNVDGIDTFYDLFFDASSPTLRSLATLTNTNAEAVAATVAYGGDLGSDSSTRIEATRSGDAVWDVMNDGWVVTSDRGDKKLDGYDPSDPLLTFARFDPFAIEVASASPTVPGREDGPYDIDEFIDVFTLDLAAGQTQRLMFFTQLNPTVATAVAGATTFTDLTTLGSTGLLAGLSEPQIDSIVNWNVPTVASDVPEPGTLLLGVIGAGAFGLARRRRRDG